MMLRPQSSSLRILWLVVVALVGLPTKGFSPGVIADGRRHAVVVVLPRGTSGLMFAADPKDSSDDQERTGLLVDPSKNKKTPPPPQPARKNFRMQLFSYLNQPQVEVASTLAVLGSCFLVAVDTLPNSPTALIHSVLSVVNLIFAADFFVRWYAAGNFKALYLTKPLVALDIVVILIPLLLTTSLEFLDQWVVPLGGGGIGRPPSPTQAGDAHSYLWIPAALKFDSAGLQNLLLLRILRLRRVLTDISTFTRFEMALGLPPKDVRPYQLQLARVLLSIFTLLSVASGLIYTAEHEVNPNIPDYFAALYFGLTTLTTVGFGDIAPITPEGRIVVCMSILAGVAVIPAQAASLLDAVLQFQEDRKGGGPRVKVRRRGANVSTRPILGTSETVASSMQELQAAPTVAVTTSTITSSHDEQWVGWMGRCCLNCEATDHREDALYCWSCGSEL